MADEEQFSLCWNNFNSNLSAGFHESLCRGDLVDVTLAAEGQLVKAHRLVLSVCSPYFRKMFTQMPANQHAFVFLKDVSHTALKDLIQFMYCGEVNVRQEALPTFISTAEALQIKGLTETGEPSTSATNISASGATTLATGSHPSPIKVITSGAGSSASASSAQNNHSPNRQPRIVQQRRAATVFKVEQSEDSSDDKPIVVQQKRTSQRINLNSNVQQPATKRQRANDSSAATSTATLEDGTTATIVHVQESSQHPQIVQLQMQQPIAQQGQIISTISMSTDDKLQDTEFIDIHGDLPTKSEPEYGDDLGDVETIEQDPDQDMDAEHDPDQDDEQADQEQDHDDGDGEEDATYVEDESYGDLKYDDSYFTENDETKAGTSAFSDSYADGAVAETSGTDAQAIPDLPIPVTKVPAKRGRPRLSQADKAKNAEKNKRLSTPSKIILLTDTELQALFKTTAHEKKYVSCISGSMSVLLNEHIYEFVCNRNGNHYYRCSQWQSAGCYSARILVRGAGVYIIDETHTHEPLPQELRPSDIHTIATGGKVMAKPQPSTGDPAHAIDEQAPNRKTDKMPMKADVKTIVGISVNPKTAELTPGISNRTNSDENPTKLVTPLAEHLKSRMANKLKAMQSQPKTGK